MPEDPHPPHSGGGLSDRFTDLIGLEELEDFRLSHVFSEVIKKHTVEEMEEQLITGTTRHTPTLAELEVGWAKPWLFARLLGGSAILAFILYVGFELFNNINLIPGMIFVGSFAVPVSTLIFFLEMNVPRNISIFKVMQLLFVGGMGFAAFESAGYAFRYVLEGGVTAGGELILFRGLLSPFMHIVWTANAAAALWMVKGDKPFRWEMLEAPAFLRVFLAMVVIHMIWNAPFGLIRLPIVQDLKFVLLGILGWIICFRLVQRGLRQLNKARQELALPAIMEGPDPVG
jgi:RsiW-degrading membrane proteinase PrsW (M82 family)